METVDEDEITKKIILTRFLMALMKVIA